MKPDADKLRRASAWSGLVEGGRIYYGPGQTELINVMLSVPPSNPRHGAVWDAAAGIASEPVACRTGVASPGRGGRRADVVHIGNPG